MSGSDARAGLDDAADDVHVIGPLLPLAADADGSVSDDTAGMVPAGPALVTPEPSSDDPR